MRQLLLTVFLVVSVFASNAQESIVEQAAKAYQGGEYRKAIELYQKELEAANGENQISAELYYNLGNAYFRANEIPEAILNYERAQLYAPGDRDITHNIQFAQTKIEDKILTADNFFLGIWFDAVQNLFTSNTWAVVSVLFFLFFLGGLTLFFFSPKLILKKAGFYVVVVFLLAFVFTTLFASNQKDKIENRNTAIVITGVVPIVSSPSSDGKELFVLHAGTKVAISKIEGNWYEIEIADGNVGWVQGDKIEII